MTARKSLAAIFYSDRGKVSDKWEQYLAIYEAELAPWVRARRPVRLLEIGVQNGGSLELWARYLPSGSVVLGLDVDPAVAALKFRDAVRAEVVDATDERALDTALQNGLFDVIIDDGSHRSPDILTSLAHLLPRLAPGGRYFVEDLHASYWPAYGGGLRAKGSAIEGLKALVEAINLDHVHREELDEGEAERFALLHARLARITFYDSLAVIERLPADRVHPYRRVIGGSHREVHDQVVAATPEHSSASVGGLLFTEPLARAADQRLVAQLEATREALRRTEAQLAEALAAAQPRPRARSRAGRS